MYSVASVLLGADEDQIVDSAMKIAALGFPNGVVLTCVRCDRREVLSLEETAKAMVQGWSRCHGLRMIVETSG